MKVRSIKRRILMLLIASLAIMLACSAVISYIFYSDALANYWNRSENEDIRMQFFIIFICAMVMIAIIITIIAAVLTDIYLLKPVTDMTKAISSIHFDEQGMQEEENDPKYALKNLNIDSGDEIEELYHALQNFQMDISEYLLSLREDSWEAEHDSMTMLSNRTRYEKRKNEVYPYADMIYIAALNVINLRRVNEEISVEAGDGIISKVARELRRLSTESIHTYRLEEDHFMVVFCGYLEEEAVAIISKWVERVGRLNRNSDSFECRLVWGGSFGSGKFDVDNVYKHADTELYCNTAVAKKGKALNL
jgi:GGDEF domain-containing protein